MPRRSATDFNEGVALGIARNLARTHYRDRHEPTLRSLVDVDERLRERGLSDLVQPALAAYADEWTRLERMLRRRRPPEASASGG